MVLTSHSRELYLNVADYFVVFLLDVQTYTVQQRYLHILCIFEFVVEENKNRAQHSDLPFDYSALLVQGYTVRCTFALFEPSNTKMVHDCSVSLSQRYTFTKETLKICCVGLYISLICTHTMQLFTIIYVNNLIVTLSFCSISDFLQVHRVVIDLVLILQHVGIKLYSIHSESCKAFQKEFMSVSRIRKGGCAAERRSAIEETHLNLTVVIGFYVFISVFFVFRLTLTRPPHYLTSCFLPSLRLDCTDTK